MILECFFMITGMPLAVILSFFSKKRFGGDFPGTEASMAHWFGYCAMVGKIMWAVIAAVGITTWICLR